jgi:hypothetical protein
VCADVIDESGEVADVELQTDNEDTFIAPCEKNLQHHSDQEPEKNESRAEQLSTCLGWDRVEEEEPADGAEPDTVIRVPDQSSSRPLVRRNLPVVRVTQSVDCSSDGKSRLRRAYVVVLPRMTLADRLMGNKLFI